MHFPAEGASPSMFSYLVHIGQDEYDDGQDGEFDGHDQDQDVDHHDIHWNNFVNSGFSYFGTRPK